MQPAHRTIVKLGGSLLNHPDLISYFRRWLDANIRFESVGVVIGGGKTVDAMRELWQCQPLSTTLMHWRCIDLLDATFSIGCELLPDFLPISSEEDFRLWANDVSATNNQSHRLLRVKSFYSNEPMAQAPKQSFPCERLPEDWRTTTDTLALHAAIQSRATRLVLLKSCRVEHIENLGHAVELGIVDDAFLNHLDSKLNVELIQLIPESDNPLDG